jgi:hypothetical protein
LHDGEANVGDAAAVGVVEGRELAGSGGDGGVGSGGI